MQVEAPFTYVAMETYRFAVHIDRRCGGTFPKSLGSIYTFPFIQHGAETPVNKCRVACIPHVHT